ncbi:MAG: hypothetical protein AAB229_10600 [Candidatus Hydrogenedentota bacterium]
MEIAAQCEVKLREGRTEYRPGETIKGSAAWLCEKAPSSAEIRLFWHTTGRGTRDMDIVATQKVDALMEHGAAEFSFTLPPAPYSFSGKLISIVWAVELVLQPFNEAARAEFTMGPAGKSIVLHKRIEVDRMDLEPSGGRGEPGV